MSVTLWWHLAFSYSTNRYATLVWNITLYTHMHRLIFFNQAQQSNKKWSSGFTCINIVYYAKYLKQSIVGKGQKCDVKMLIFASSSYVFHSMTFQQPDLQLSLTYLSVRVCVHARSVLTGPGCINAYHSLPDETAMLLLSRPFMDNNRHYSS